MDKYSEIEINLAKSLSEFDAKPYPKSEVNPHLIHMTMEFLKTVPLNVSYEFEGDYGHVVRIANGYKGWGETISFEIAYTKDSIRVYSDRHNGYLVASYFNLSKEDFEFLAFKALLHNTIKTAFGLE